jgi:hypothetical protein
LRACPRSLLHHFRTEPHLTYCLDVSTLAGYCPGWTTVPVPINGSNKHTGRLPDTAELDKATLKSDERASE